ncbi:MAG: protein kinase [Myxococcales bacterium]|nr:protein kinase [Myxococcales bacterium]
MGHVWRVEGPDGPAALKLVTAEIAGLRERFALEVRALDELHHPNVIRALSHGETDDGTPYLALELLDGQTLEDRLEVEGVVPLDEALRIARAVALGLAAAHAVGIVHRDVKPGNIFLSRDGTVKVIDFGIAFWDPGDGRLPLDRLTAPGTLVGTPSFMAPEQAMGDRDEDARTDVWGLGAVLYNLVSGRTPFDGGASYLAELTRILNEPPDPLPSDVPKPVASLILHALSKPREARLSSMEAFVAAIDALDEATSQVAPASPPPRDSAILGLDAEVRLVSAVLVEHLDDPDDRFDELAARHGGRGSRLRGGGGVAIFGGEQWLGDEAERAVRFALEVRPLALRVGVGTGKAVPSREGRGGVTGGALRAAERALRIDEPEVPTLAPPAMVAGVLSTEARMTIRPTMVALCPDTQRRARGAFEIAGGRVVGVRPGGRALEPREVGGREVPFVGRDAALDELIDRFDEVDDQDRATACLVVGAAGIGKSRLRFELLRWLEDEQVVVRRFEARGELANAQSSFGVVRQLLRRHAALPEGSDEARGREQIESLVAAANLEEDQAMATGQFLGALLGVSFPGDAALQAARSDPQLMADGIHAACHSLFDGLTARGLVLVMVEDAQWADAASLELLESLVERLEDRPLMILLTARSSYFDTHQTFAEAPRIELSDLDDAAIATIVESVLGRPEPAVVERASGNPYLAEELSMAVREGADPDALPVTVEGAVLARLDRLAPSEKDLLKRAAVLGRRFWSEALVALGQAEVDPLLSRLRRRELVLPRAESELMGCRQWLFRQAVVFEVCRGLLTDDQRRELHRAAASWLSRREDAAPVEVAQHFMAAEDPRRSLLWWLRALHGARERGESRDVLRYSDRVLALADAISLPASERFEQRLLRCEARFWLAERSGLEEELQLAWQIMEGHEDELGRSARARFRCWLAEHLALSAHLEEAKRAAREATRIADEAAVVELRVQSRRVLSEVLVALGDLDRAVAVAGEALEIAKRGEGGMVRATASRAVATVELRRGRLSSASFYFDMARNLCRELGASREAVLSGIGLAEARLLAGGDEAVDRLLDKSLETARSLGMRSLVGWVHLHRGRAAFLRGDYHGARRLLGEVVDSAVALDEAQLEVASRSHRAILHAVTDRPRLGLEDAEIAIAKARVGPEEILARTAAVLAKAAMDRHEEVVAESAAVLDAATRAGGHHLFEIELLLARRDALLALGQTSAASVALARAQAAFDRVQQGLEQEELRARHATLPAHARLLHLER